MKNVLKKLFLAKASVSQMKNAKEGSNDFSKYNYFTPEQVNRIVQTVNDENGLFTAFNLKRNEYGVFGTLTVYDIESGESIEFEMASEIPEIKATNAAQQLGGCVTYTERYLKMSVYGIVDNSLDFDTTENTKARADKKATTKAGDLDRFEKTKQNVKFMQDCLDEEDFINKVKNRVNEIGAKMTKQNETDLRICYQNAKAMENIENNLPFE